MADLGAGQGFFTFTMRLARAVGSRGRVYAVDIEDAVIEQLLARTQRAALAQVAVVLGSE